MDRYQIISYILKEIKGFTGYTILSSIIRIGSKLSKAVLFLLSVNLIENLIGGNEIAPFKILFTVFLTVFLSYLDTYTSHDVSFRILPKIRERAYRHLSKIAPAGLKEKASVDVVASVLYDVDVFEVFYAHILIEWIGTFSSIIILGGYLATISPISSLVIVITCLCLVVTTQFFMKRSEINSTESRKQFWNLNATLSDGIFGVKDILAYHLTEQFVEKITSTNKAYHKARFIFIKKAYLEKNIYSLISILGVSSVILTVFLTDITSPLIALVLSIAILECLQSSLDDGLNYGAVFAAAKRVYSVLQLENPITSYGVIKAEPTVPCVVEFSSVSFSYPEEIKDQERKILNDISFVAKPSSVTAIVASSGGGKTTIAKLLQRFWDINSGEILINDINIKDFAENELPKIVTSVSQELFLFHGSIEDNLRMVKPTATTEELENVCKLAQAYDFINELPNSFQTKVEQNGSNFSGGERQRIALAQAFLLNSPVLILDEASSALDTNNEFLINQAIQSNLSNKTIILIAHRLSTIQTANQIVFMEEGKIVQVGTYSELMKCENFRELVMKESEK